MGELVAAICHSACRPLIIVCSVLILLGLIQKVATDIDFFFLVIVLALIHWVLDTDLSSYFSPLPLYCYSFPKARTMQHSTNTRAHAIVRPGMNLWSSPLCGCDATSLVEYMGSVPAKFDIISGIVNCADLQ